MSTRGLLVIKTASQQASFFIRWDAYPTGQGITAYKFIAKHREELKKSINYCVFGKGVDTKFYTWFKNSALGRSTGINVDNAINQSRLIEEQLTDALKAKEYKPVVFIDNYDFATDGVFCEYLYFADLDNNTFEIHMKNGRLKKTDRFFNLQTPFETPVKIVCSLPILEDTDVNEERAEMLFSQIDSAINKNYESRYNKAPLLSKDDKKLLSLTYSVKVK